MKSKSGWNSVKNFFTKLGKKNLVIIGAVVLIGAAVWLNWVFFAGDKGGNDGYTYDASAGMSTTYGTKLVTETGAGDQKVDAEADYFSTIEVSRRRARDEALEVLNAVVRNEKADDAVKTEAVAEITQISKEMTAESNIESLICSKGGFAQCLAVISGDSASIVVSGDASVKLTQAQLAQINAIVYEQSGIQPTNVTISVK